MESCGGRQRRHRQLVGHPRADTARMQDLLILLIVLVIIGVLAWFALKALLALLPFIILGAAVWLVWHHRAAIAAIFRRGLK